MRFAMEDAQMKVGGEVTHDGNGGSFHKWWDLFLNQFDNVNGFILHRSLIENGNYGKHLGAWIRDNKTIKLLYGRRVALMRHSDEFLEKKAYEEFGTHVSGTHAAGDHLQEYWDLTFSHPLVTSEKLA